MQNALATLNPTMFMAAYSLLRKIFRKASFRLIFIIVWFISSLVKMFLLQTAYSQQPANYSLLKLLTGLAIAAFTVWKLEVSTAASNIPAPLAANIHQLMVVRSAKPSIHLFMAYHPIGVTITKASTISNITSVDNKVTICVTVAPTTLRTPISLVR